MTLRLSDAKVIIMAGGAGSRFWPVSRMSRPKQFLEMGDSGESLIQGTANRVEPLVGMDNIVVVTNKLHEQQVRAHVPFASVLCEPEAKNTAAAIGFAAAFVAREDPSKVMVTLPSDHVVANVENLRETLRRAIQVAKSSDALVTIGIPPTSAHTGYGYIQAGEPSSEYAVKVERFCEKPDREKAGQFVESGNYLWNSGMFAFRAEVFLEATQKYLPTLREGLAVIQSAFGTAEEEAVIAQEFSKLESVSVDYGIMEHADNCLMVQALPYGWDDVGAWDAWAELFSRDGDGNVLKGDVISVESRNCVVYSKEKTVAIVGADDLMVIESEDALLVVPRKSAQDVKKVVELLKASGRSELV